MSKEWDARTYHRVADPQFGWGRRLLESVTLRGDEVVIDAGCGSGRIARLILERIPHGRLIAVDLSQQMLDAARANLDTDFAGRVEYVHADLLDLELRAVADLAFSTATFHWVPDHPRLFARLYDALRPGGQIVAQFGGRGNVDRVRRRAERIMATPPFDHYFAGWVGPWHYPDAELTAERLRQAGFIDVETTLFPEPTTFADAERYREFVAAVVFRVHLQQIPDPRLKEQFLDALVRDAAAASPPFTLDYVRLNLRARRPVVS